MSQINYKDVIYPNGAFVQLSASAINPAGALPAAVDDIGITSCLKFVDGSTRVAAGNFAIPLNADKTQDMSIRLGWAASTNTGNVRWSVTYLWLTNDDDISATGTEVIVDDTVSSTANGYVFSSFTIPAPDSADRVLAMRVTRYGGATEDTCTGDVYLLGLLLAYEGE